MAASSKKLNPCLYYEWGTLREGCKRHGCGKSKWLKIRNDYWLEGFEFVRESDTSVTYNLTLIGHWWAHRHEPEIHQQAREAYTANFKKLREGVT